MERPDKFTPEGLPPNTKSMLVPFWQNRDKQVPRITLVHTNGASGIATNQSSYNWATAKPESNTLPHYQVQLDGQAAKYIPTDRRGLDNATVDPKSEKFASLPLSVRTDILAHGQVRNWSIGIETSDLGYGVDKPGDASGFTEAQIETLAGILAYDSILWNIPLSYPTEWWGTGTACHTEPFEYPYWTIFPGKSCPGWKKKELMRSRVLPLAQQIKDSWLETSPPPPVGDEDMFTPVSLWSRDGNLQQFMIGKESKALMYRVFVPGTGWTKWESKGGQYLSAPSVTEGDGRIDVFAQGLDGNVWQTVFYYGGETPGWQNPILVGMQPL